LSRFTLCRRWKSSNLLLSKGSEWRQSGSLRRAVKKNVTEKVDLAGPFPYKRSLDDMDSRCSSSIAALTVFMGGGACAFFALSACAGDRIEFSAPAIPLSVPQAEVEIKEPAKMIGAGDFSGETVGGVEMAMPAQYYIVKPKHGDKNDWGLNPRLDRDPDLRQADDWFASESDSTRGTTNGNNLNKQGSNPNASGNLLQQRNDSGLDGGPNGSRYGGQSGFDGDNSRFGAQIGLDRDNLRFDARNGLDRDYSKYGAKNGFERDYLKDYSKYGASNGSDKSYGRSNDRLGRSSSSASDESIWTKAFRHDGSGTDRLDAMRVTPSTSEVKEFGGGSYEDKMNNMWLGQDPGHPAPLSPGYTGLTPLDDGQSRQFGEQAAQGQGSLRAWEPPAAPVSSFRGSANPEQFNAYRVVAPNRPAILPMPQRPGDPH
jgi:hypothetical protein